MRGGNPRYHSPARGRRIAELSGFLTGMQKSHDERLPAATPARERPAARLNDRPHRANAPTGRRTGLEAIPHPAPTGTVRKIDGVAILQPNGHAAKIVNGWVRRYSGRNLR